MDASGKHHLDPEYLKKYEMNKVTINTNKHMMAWPEKESCRPWGEQIVNNQGLSASTSQSFVIR